MQDFVEIKCWYLFLLGEIEFDAVGDRSVIEVAVFESRFDLEEDSRDGPIDGQSCLHELDPVDDHVISFHGLNDHIEWDSERLGHLE